jgi:hypothetical protein
MNNEFEGSIHVLTNVPSQHVFAGTEGTAKNLTETSRRFSRDSNRKSPQ